MFPKVKKKLFWYDFKKKSSASWTQEMIQDISSYFEIDAEAELTALLQLEVTRSLELLKILGERDIKKKKNKKRKIFWIRYKFVSPGVFIRESD